MVFSHSLGDMLFPFFLFQQGVLPALGDWMLRKKVLR